MHKEELRRKDEELKKKIEQEQAAFHDAMALAQEREQKLKAENERLLRLT